jgi:cytochrome oxidase assembly protein ShyY1
VVEGVVRGSETPGSFVPANSPPQWYWLDAPAMAGAAQLPPETPLVEVIADATARCVRLEHKIVRVLDAPRYTGPCVALKSRAKS